MPKAGKDMAARGEEMYRKNQLESITQEPEIKG